MRETPRTEKYRRVWDGNSGLFDHACRLELELAAAVAAKEKASGAGKTTDSEPHPQCSPPSEPMSDDPRDVRIHELVERVILLEAHVEDLRRWRRGDYDEPVEFKMPEASDAKEDGK